MNHEQFSTLEKALGHTFTRPELLEQALTHSSFAHEADLPDEAPTGERHHNEQLEFLGDAVLGFVTGEVLFERFPHFNEGQLSKLRAHLVSARHLVKVANELNLGRYLRLGKGEEKSGGRGKSALLCDSLEATIAAMYLDTGLERTREFIVKRILEPELRRIGDDVENGAAITDHKSGLQELLQSAGWPQPSYRVVREEGPEHRKTFTVEVGIEDDQGELEYTGTAEGSTKKKAEQRAARQALEHLRSGRFSPNNSAKEEAVVEQ